MKRQLSRRRERYCNSITYSKQQNRRYKIHGCSGAAECPAFSCSERFELVGNSETFVSSRKGQKFSDQLKTNGHLYDGLPVRITLKGTQSFKTRGFRPGDARRRIHCTWHVFHIYFNEDLRCSPSRYQMKNLPNISISTVV